MARQPRVPTEEDMNAAREIVRRFDSLPKETCEQMELIGMRYKKINGIPVDQLDDDRVYRIAERLLIHSNRLVRGPTNTILDNIGRLEQTRDLDQREALEERICIQLEANNIPDN